MHSMKNTESGGEASEDQFYGSVTVGERGQIVIPAEARRRLGIRTGDKLLAIGHPATGGVLFCRIEVFREIIGKFIEGVERVQASEEPLETVED